MSAEYDALSDAEKTAISAYSQRVRERLNALFKGQDAVEREKIAAAIHAVNLDFVTMVPSIDPESIHVAQEGDEFVVWIGESPETALAKARAKYAASFADYHGAINRWFELSYAEYLTVPRRAMQSMPAEWQERMAACLTELDDRVEWRPKDGRYYVELRGNDGRIRRDPFREYRHVAPMELRPPPEPPCERCGDTGTVGGVNVGVSVVGGGTPCDCPIGVVLHGGGK